MSEDAVRQALATLARTASSENESAGTTARTDDHATFRETIERATVAIEDVDDAAAFVTDVGVDELERAVERADQSVSACADDGRRALDAFRAFRDAAAGDHFHSGRGTSLAGDDEPLSK